MMTLRKAIPIWLAVTAVFFVLDWLTHPHPGPPLTMAFIAAVVAYVLCLVTMASWHAWQTIREPFDDHPAELDDEYPHHRARDLSGRSGGPG